MWRLFDSLRNIPWRRNEKSGRTQVTDRDNAPENQEKKEHEVIQNVHFSQLQIIQQAAADFHALGFDVSVHFRSKNQAQLPLAIQNGDVEVLGSTEVQKQFKEFVEIFLGAIKKTNADMTDETTKTRVFQLLRKQIHEKIIEPLALEKQKSVTQLYREKLSSPGYLPSIDDIKNAFPSIEDTDAFREYVIRNRFYEVFTQEYIRSLAAYLTYQAQQKYQKETITILEVGAGDGRLSRYLQVYLLQSGTEKIKIHATDDYSWEHIHSKNEDMLGVVRGENVEEVDYKKAVIRYKPDMIISSWMPPNTDWTEFFREQDVPEYILIGKADDGVSGTIKNTWDAVPSRESSHYDPKQKYIREDEEWRFPQQISINDVPPFDAEQQYSSTVVFQLNPRRK